MQFFQTVCTGSTRGWALHTRRKGLPAPSPLYELPNARDWLAPLHDGGAKEYTTLTLLKAQANFALMSSRPEVALPGLTFQR